MKHLNSRLIIPTAVIAMLLGLLQPSQAQWVKTNSPSGASINGLLVSGNNIFAAVYGEVFRSTNNGSSWTAVNSGISARIISFAVSGNSIFVGTANGLFRSNNNGDKWTAAYFPFTSAPVTSIAVCGTTIFAVANNRNLRCSVDDAKSWVALDSGLSGLYLYTLTVIGNDLFAGTDHGVYRSTNKGMTWTAANSGISDVMVTSCITNGGYLFTGTDKGIFRSADNGASWTAVNSGLTDSDILSIAASGNNLFAATDVGGIFRSIDNGNHWTAVNKGLYNWNICCFAVLGTDIFVGTRSGVFLSTNNGDNWTAVNSGLGHAIGSIAANGSNIIALANKSAFLSTNKGTDWINITSGIENKEIISVAWCGNDLFLLTREGVYHSINKGLNWSAVNVVVPDSTLFYSMAASGNNILIGTVSDGVFLYTNKGVSWQILDSDLAHFDYPVSVAISGNCILAGTAEGLFQFTDTGWASFGLKAKHIHSIVMSGNTVIACTSNDIFQYSDTGWTSIAFGLNHIMKLAVKDNSIFATTIYEGVFHFMGTKWIAVNSGLLDFYSAISLAIDDDNYIYAGTGSGVWRCPIAEITKTKDIPVPQKSNQTTFRIHAPSASSTMLSIEYSLQFPQRVHFTICNLSGRVIQTRSVECFESGIRRLLFDNRSLAPGCYNLQMRTKTITENKLFTISR